jgi:MoxR-like ATPase
VDHTDYLQRRYVDDQSAAQEIRALTQRALKTLVDTPFGEFGWPYSLTNYKPLHPARKLSHSTVAMILHALAVAYGKISKSVLVPAVRTGTGTEPYTDAVDKLLKKGTATLVADLGGPQQVEGELTRSSTWGSDDVLTLTWLYELLNAGIDQSDKAQEAMATIRRLAEALMNSLRDDPQSAQLSSRPTRHPFVMLRTVQLAKAVGYASPGVSVSELPDAFLGQLHRELSINAIRDGEFDPACLVFALEGLLLVNAEAVSEALVDKIVSVLGSATSVGSHWRPVRPLDASDEGRILLPQSVEVANSYLRVCDLYPARRSTGEPLFTQSFDTLQSYANWLASRVSRVQVVDLPGPFDGWQSEHTYKRDDVHLWATSQVVLFLQHYRAMLQQHAARCSRIAAGLDFRPSPLKSNDKRIEDWGKTCGQEPLKGHAEGSALRVYEKIQQLFVLPRDGSPQSQAMPRSYSVLLYGPPGTGKTGFSRDLAEVLEYDMITVTLSDFIRGGTSEVEQRAKQVFDVLETQSHTVILFDEIDRLVVERSSELYETQESMFQFMTNSMLTKIKDLRDKEGPVFVIATNYAERIDTAIKRTGRVDEQLLLLPPDREQRKNIINELVTKVEKAEEEKAKKQQSETGEHTAPKRLNLDVDRIARGTPLYVFTDLKQLFEAIARSVLTGEAPDTATTRALKRYRATINLDGYRTRFPAGEDVSLGPWKEFALLTYLNAEVDKRELADWMRPVLEKILGDPDLLDELDGDPVVTTLRSLLPP